MNELLSGLLIFIAFAISWYFLELGVIAILNEVRIYKRFKSIQNVKRTRNRR